MDTWFRMRHLQSVSGRNVNISVEDLNSNHIFFGLSTTDTEHLGYFYQSSKCDNLLNPHWENIDLSYENIKRFSFLDNFLITFFLCKKQKNKILLEVKVHISGLSLYTNLGALTRIKDDDYQMFLFQFNNKWYSSDFSDEETRNEFFNVVELPVKIKKKLYNTETIKKFLDYISEDNQQVAENIVKEQKNLKNKIYERSSRICLLNQKRNRIICLRNQILLEQKFRNQKLKELEKHRKSVELLKLKVEKALYNQERTQLDIVKRNSNLKQYQDFYLKISNDYMLRMYQLIHELAKIFPITPTEWPNSFNVKIPNTITILSTDKLSICNLHLPNSDKQILLSQDCTIFAAIGMVCQLLSALSKIYDIPLRYPLISDDSKTAIIDYIIDIDENERNFLLVKSTAPNFRLQYAIYLLNLNIAAIRGYFSLSTKSPDRTLWNINTLIEGKNRVVGSGSNNNLTHSTQNSNSASQTNLSSNFSQSPDMTSPLVTSSFVAIN